MNIRKFFIRKPDSCLDSHRTHTKGNKIWFLLSRSQFALHQMSGRANAGPQDSQSILWDVGGFTKERVPEPNWNMKCCVVSPLSHTCPHTKGLESTGIALAIWPQKTFERNTFEHPPRIDRTWVGKGQHNRFRINDARKVPLELPSEDTLSPGDTEAPWAAPRG